MQDYNKLQRLNRPKSSGKLSQEKALIEGLPISLFSNFKIPLFVDLNYCCYSWPSSFSTFRSTFKEIQGNLIHLLGFLKSLKSYSLLPFQKSAILHLMKTSQYVGHSKLIDLRTSLNSAINHWKKAHTMYKDKKPDDELLKTGQDSPGKNKFRLGKKVNEDLSEVEIDKFLLPFIKIHKENV